MKKVILTLFIIAGSTLTLLSQSSTEKENAKDWEKRLKALTPQQYERLLTENRFLDLQVTALKNEQANIDRNQVEMTQQLIDAQTKIEELKIQIDQTSESLEIVTKKLDENPLATGIVYKVQVAAIKNEELVKLLAAGKDFSGEVDKNGLRRYTLGIFENYWDANTFRKYLSQKCVDGAWVVKYENGERSNP